MDYQQQTERKVTSSLSSLKESLSNRALSLDKLYRFVVKNNFFSKGLGSVEALSTILSLKGKVYSLVSPFHPIYFKSVKHCKTYKLVSGCFLSPIVLIAPEIIPEESKVAHFQLVLPKDFPHERLPFSYLPQFSEKDFEKRNNFKLLSKLMDQHSQLEYNFDTIFQKKSPTHSHNIFVPRSNSIVSSLLSKSSHFDSSLISTQIEKTKKNPPTFSNPILETKETKKDDSSIPLCLVYSATGDHSFWRRRMLTSVPLLTKGSIASVLLENPLYASRKPRDQFRSNLRYVIDLYLMGLLLQFDTVALLNWFNSSNSFSSLGLAGIYFLFFYFFI